MTTESALQELEVQECWELLQTQRVGRLAFSDRALPAIRPLNYVVDGHRIVLRVSAKGLGERLDGQVVAFEVDDTDVVGQLGWSVVVTGTLRLQERPSEQLRTLSAPASWAGEGHQDAAVLTVGQITGRRIRAATA
jgi:nitroimidazol reductase NimA-like FMN-containing flavoprotein (pyridoxamine 5'-phosphate oxidase superfamily)